MVTTLHVASDVGQLAMEFMHLYKVILVDIGVTEAICVNNAGNRQAWGQNRLQLVPNLELFISRTRHYAKRNLLAFHRMKRLAIILLVLIMRVYNPLGQTEIISWLYMA